MLTQEITKEEMMYRLKSGKNFLGILNDIKSRPEDAANDLGLDLSEIESIIQGNYSCVLNLLIVNL